MFWEDAWMFAKAEWKVNRGKLTSEMAWKSVCLVWFKQLWKPEKGRSGQVNWKWFGLVWITSGRKEISLNRNRYFPERSELGLLCPRQLWACCWFEGQCALKAVPLGTKPTLNIFISIHANILQCFSCLSLVSFTWNSSEALLWAHAVSDLWQTPSQ